MTERRAARTTAQPHQTADRTAKPKNMRARLVDLSVLATSALVLAGSMLVVADVDSAHSETSVTVEQLGTHVTDSSLKRKSALSEAVSIPTPRPALVASRAPTGFVPAPRAKRKVVVVRRSRAS